MDLPAQFIPQFMGQTAIAVLAIVGAAAARGIDNFVNSGNDFRNGKLLGRTLQRIAAARAACAPDQAALAQAGEQLLQVGQ